MLPYQNKSLADLPAEIWKDIPGFEGTYQASTMGRIKSLDRIVPHPRLYQQFVKGQILSNKVNQNQNLKISVGNKKRKFTTRLHSESPFPSLKLSAALTDAKTIKPANR